MARRGDSPVHGKDVVEGAHDADADQEQVHRVHERLDEEPHLREPLQRPEPR